MQKLKLSARSRRNRMFFDNLIRELAICLNVGDTALNREELFPTYVNHAQAGELVNDEYYIQINRDTGCLFRPLAELLPNKTLDDLDALLAEAPPELKHCGSRRMITDYLSQRTDLADCHFSALNEMQSIR